MRRKQNKNLVPIARNLRKNTTKEERKLWYEFLRDYPIRFTRQKILGKYIADFYSGKLKLVIELDGSQHYTEKGEEYDKCRTEFLGGYNITVLRISNLDIMTNFYGVCTYIDRYVKMRLGEEVG